MCCEVSPQPSPLQLSTPSSHSPFLSLISGISGRNHPGHKRRFPALPVTGLEKSGGNLNRKETALLCCPFQLGLPCCLQVHLPFLAFQKSPEQVIVQQQPTKTSLCAFPPLPKLFHSPQELGSLLCRAKLCPGDRTMISVPQGLLLFPPLPHSGNSWIQTSALDMEEMQSSPPDPEDTSDGKWENGKTGKSQMPSGITPGLRKPPRRGRICCLAMSLITRMS